MYYNIRVELLYIRLYSEHKFVIKLLLEHYGSWFSECRYFNKDSINVGPKAYLGRCCVQIDLWVQGESYKIEPYKISRSYYILRQK